VSSGTGSGTGTDSGNGLLPASNPLNEVYQELSKYVEANNLQNQIDLESTDTYVMVRLKDMVLFVPDQTTMIKSSEPILGEIEKALASVYDKIDDITISGHTADPNNDGEKSSVFEWQLSTGRAVNVLTYMVGLGLPQPKLSIGGYSHYKPIGDNNTASGSAQNRRVEIKVSKNTAGVSGSASSGTKTSSAATSSADTSAH
jgi:chemotaxis protein MotB